MMVGLIIGVGIFGVPFVLAQSGILIGIIYFLILGAIMTLNHLLFGEALLRTGVKHHLAGLANIYLNKKWEYIVVMVTVLGFYGALVAYIILGGQFLEILFGQFFGNGLFAYQVIFFMFMAFFVLVGLRLVAFTELLMTAFLLIAISIILVSGAPKINFSNFFHFDASKAFLPYGVILFSVAGAAAVPEIVEILSRSKKKIKSTIICGSIIPIVITLAFGLVVVGISGLGTTEDAIDGLGVALGEWVKFLGAAFGFFAVATSFLILALYIKEQFWFDLKMNKHLSWFLACFIPFFIFLLGSRDFISVISFTGAVFAGIEGILIIWIYTLARKKGERKPEYKIRVPFAILVLMGLIFIGGIIYEIVHILTS